MKNSKNTASKNSTTLSQTAATKYEGEDLRKRVGESPGSFQMNTNTSGEK
jgi:hypothetical protein